MRRNIANLCILCMVFLFGMTAAPLMRAQFAAPPASALSIPPSSLIQAPELARMLKSTEKEKPLILQVGSRVMYAQAHIPGSVFAGPGSTPAGIQSLEDTVASLPKNRRIVLYCGCCPWNKCPNVGPAYKRLQDLGFTKVQVLYIASNFGDDWVNKEFPAVK